MVVVIAEPLAQYPAAASPVTTPASDNDNGAGTTWVVSSCYLADNGRFGGRTIGSVNRGSYSIRFPSSNSERTYIIAGWFKWNPNDGNEFGNTVIVASRNPAHTSYNWVISLTRSGNFHLTGPGSSFTTLPIASAHCPVTTNVWHYIEIKTHQHDSSGTLEMRLDGVTVLNVSGIDTQNNSGNPSFMFSGQEEVFDWEDILIMDTTGTVMNDFVGDMRYELVPVDGDGTIVNWTPTSGDNYTTIDDPVGAPDDGDYIESSTTDQDNYAVHVPVTAPDHTAIYFAQLMVRTEADASGDEIALQVDSNGTVDRGPDQVLVNGGWRYRRQAWELDPDTGSPWTLSAINAAEWGVRKRV